VDIYLHAFLTSTEDGVVLSASGPGRFILSTHWIGGWVRPSVDLDAVMKRKNPIAAPWWWLNPGHPSRSLISIPTELPWLHALLLCWLKCPPPSLYSFMNFVLLNSPFRSEACDVTFGFESMLFAKITRFCSSHLRLQITTLCNYAYNDSPF
jgi:hypothetical protein